MHVEQTLDVSITSNPHGMIHQATSMLNLTCLVSGQSHTQLSYQWTSTCTGSCFVLGSTSQSVVVTDLRSTDSGNHTCMVTDSLGNQGMEMIQIIVGKLITSDVIIIYFCCMELYVLSQFYQTPSSN